MEFREPVPSSHINRMLKKIDQIPAVDINRYGVLSDITMGWLLKMKQEEIIELIKVIEELKPIMNDNRRIIKVIKDFSKGLAQYSGAVDYV